MAGIYFYWNSPSSPFRTAPPLPFSLFALASAAGWIWVPSMVIFSEQLSAATAFVGAIGAFLLTAALRHATSSLFAPVSRAPSDWEADEGELFDEALYRAPREVHGYVIAICLYGAGWALATHSNYTACTLLALSASLFAWKRTFAPGQQLDPDREYKRAALRLAFVFIPAVLVTIWSLIDGVGHRNRLEAIAAAQSRDNAQSLETMPPNPSPPTQASPAMRASSSGPSRRRSRSFLRCRRTRIFSLQARSSRSLSDSTGRTFISRPAGVRTRRLTRRRARPSQRTSRPPIPFRCRSRRARLCRPPFRLCAAAQWRSTSRIAITSRGPLRWQCCCAIRPNRARPAVYLGQEPIESTQPMQFAFKSAPVFETLRFEVPAHPSLRRFDEITVMLLPDWNHALVGPKIAIREFELIPR